MGDPARNSKLAREVLKSYKSRHWGIPPTKLVHVSDRYTGGVKGVVQMGTLEKLHIEERKRGGASFDLDFTHFKPKCHLAFKPTGSQRLYCVLTPAAEKKIASELWSDDPDAPRYRLSDLARFAPGRQNNYSYPNVIVQCPGWIVWLEYFTTKKETPSTKGYGGEAIYRHMCGEESGKLPLLGVSEDGRVWFVGGNYSTMAGGVAD